MHKLVWIDGDSLRVLAVFQGEQSSIPNTILYPPTLAQMIYPMPFSGLCGHLDIHGTCIYTFRHKHRHTHTIVFFLMKDSDYILNHIS